jgi:hypothetical protein
MAIVETVKIQGDGTDLQATIDKLNAAAEKLAKSIAAVQSQYKDGFDTLTNGAKKAGAEINNNLSGSIDKISDSVSGLDNSGFNSISKGASEAALEINKNLSGSIDKVSGGIEDIRTESKKSFASVANDVGNASDGVSTDFNNLSKSVSADVNKISEAISDLDDGGFNSITNGASQAASEINNNLNGSIENLSGTIGDVRAESKKSFDAIATDATKASEAIGGIKIEPLKPKIETEEAKEDVEELSDYIKKLITLLSGVQAQSKTSFEKTETAIKEVQKETKKANNTFKETKTSIEGVRQETEKAASSFKDLVSSAKSFALVSLALDTAKDAFTANQAVADVFNTALGAVQLSVSRIFDSITKGTPLNLGTVISDSQEIVKLENQAALAAAKRTEVQLSYQLLAEQARQERDNEFNSIESRIEANDILNDILTEQLEKEKALVEQVVAATQAQYEKIPSIENEVALIQARTELVDIEERVAGQRSEFLMNQMSLNREMITYNELIQKNGEIIEGEYVTVSRIEENRRKALDLEYNKQVEILDVEIEIANQRLKSAAEGTVAQQEAYDAYLQLLQDKSAAESQYARDSKELDREVTAAKFQMAKDGIAAISALSAAFANEDEESKRRQFEFQKKLSLATAVISGIEAVQNAYTTAQKSPYTAAFPGYPYVQAGLAAAFSVAQVASIARTQYDSPDTNFDTGGSGAPSQPQLTPQFNVVGRSGINQLAQSVNERNQQPIQAYVVAGEVTNAQQLARRRARTATFG